MEKYPEKGNLILRFDIEYPIYLSRACKDILKTAFQVSKMGGEKNHHESINKIVLADKILRVHPEEQLPPM